jgi:FkbM family methyltransferase
MKPAVDCEAVCGDSVAGDWAQQGKGGRLMANLAKYLSILAAPAYWPAILRGVAPTTEHSRPLAGLEFATVIDIGANKGQFAAFAARRWPEARILCFEPLPGPRATLGRLMEDRVTVFDCALGDMDGDTLINVTEREDSSSLLPVGETQRAIFRTRQSHTQKVPVRRLDSALAAYDFAPPALMKIDVQGYEREVLAGAKLVLDRVDAVYVEASYVELYEGQALAPEVIGFLADRGFVLRGRHNAALEPGGGCVQADFLLTRPAG